MPIEPRWTSVAVYPDAVSIETALPPPGTVPAKETVPLAGARTSVPLAAPRSTPRCCPAAYGWARSNKNGRSTGPFTGHVQAFATGTGRTSAHSTRTADRRNTGPSLLPDLRTERPYQDRVVVVNTGYKVRR